MQAVPPMHIWNLGQQVLSSKAPAGRTTAPDAELFAIRLGIAKATSMAIERIILITDSLGSARRAVDPSMHPGQAYSLAVYSALRLFFSQAMAIKSTSGTALTRLSGLFISWSITM